MRNNNIQANYLLLLENDIMLQRNDEWNSKCEEEYKAIPSHKNWILYKFFQTLYLSVLPRLKSRVYII